MSKTQKKVVTSTLIVISFAIIILMGLCSTIFSSKPYVDPVLQPSFDEWKIECVVRDINYKRDLSRLDSILYAPLEIGYWGRCYGDKIIINSNSIDSTEAFLLKLVMYHELGHCAFDYAHYEFGEDIMNSSLPQEKIVLYYHFWDILREQYFSRYLPKKERKKILKRLEKQDCFCILGEDKLQDNEEQQTQHRSNTTECTH